VGIDRDALTIGELLLDLPSDSGKGTPRTGANKNVIDLRVGLVENLLSCPVVMGEGVARVDVLI